MTAAESTWRTEPPPACDRLDASRDRAPAAFMTAEWIVALLAVGLIVYLPALWGVFTFDDYPWILHNSRLEALDPWQRRPVTLLTFAANLHVAGLDPVDFHLVNIALHLA